MIKATLNNEEKPTERNYPYLGVFQDGVIILFTKPETGMVVRTTGAGAESIGGYEESFWAEEDADVYQGTVTLENE